MTTKQLLPTPITVTVNGETLSITPFPFGKLPAVSARLAPVFSAMQDLSAGAEVDFLQLLEVGGTGLMEVLEIAARKPAGFMDTVDYEDGKALAMAVFEANKDLFLKKILPDLMAAMPKTPATPAQ